MAKYHKVIEAEPYAPGLEDGFSCIKFYGICQWGFKQIGGKIIYRLCHRCPLTNVKKAPYIMAFDEESGKSDMEFINEGDYIVYLDDSKSTKYMCFKDEFEAEYELMGKD